MTKAKAKAIIKVHEVALVDSALLAEHPRNSNKQNRHTQKELKESIKENGFDENLIVCKRDDNEPGYWIVSGNHRYRAGAALGMHEFPCVVRDDWDAVEQQIQLVRRNYVRGKLDKTAFTAAVNELSRDASLGLDTIYDRMGFEDADMFAEYYEKEKRKEERVASGAVAAPQVKMIDDLGLVISSIFERFGDTVPQSFIIFPVSGKNHLYIQCTPALKRVMETVAQGCVQQNLDMNIALGGLLAIGMDSSNFKTNPDKETILDRGTELGDLNLKTMVKEDE